MKWQFEKDAEPQGSSNGFWYDLTDGGYIKPEEVLASKEQIDKVENAIKVLQDFESALWDNNLLLEF